MGNRLSDDRARELQAKNLRHQILKLYSDIRGSEEKGVLGLVHFGREYNSETNGFDVVPLAEGFRRVVKSYAFLSPVEKLVELEGLMDRQDKLIVAYDELVSLFFDFWRLKGLEVEEVSLPRFFGDLNSYLEKRDSEFDLRLKEVEDFKQSLQQKIDEAEGPPQEVEPLPRQPPRQSYRKKNVQEDEGDVEI